ncbi:MAG: class I SAM-dependent RNA methyltransferase [Archaeoglobi archaeon]|nr:class I SAM-dependent RNA methyltransferase [Archaeoglobi archaeon]
MKDVFYATCPPGLEFVAAGEIEGKGLGRVVEVREGKGRVFFRSSWQNVPRLNCLLRSVERIVFLLGRERAEGLEDVYRIVRSIDFSFIRPEWSFAVRATRVGEHNFTSIDIGRVAGKAVIDSYMEEKGVRLRVNLDEPDVIVRCDLIDDDFMVGIDTTGDEGLHKRRYRVYQHPAPLNPVLAASLVYLSGWSSTKSLLDPFCGSGTILFEAGMIARQIPICRFRKDFAFTRFFDSLPEVEEKDVELRLYGIERFRKHLEGARAIADYTGIHPVFLEGLAERIEEHLERVDFIITNPPYGLRIGKKKIIEDLYSGFLHSASKVLEEKAVVITAEREIFERYAEEYFPGFLRYDVKYGGLLTGVYVLKA